MISFDEFLRKVDTVYLDHSFEWRYGQTVMNVLADIWPDKHKELITTENDCFYDDRMVQFTLDKLEKEWTETKIHDDLPPCYDPEWNIPDGEDDATTLGLR